MASADSVPSPQEPVPDNPVHPFPNPIKHEWAQLISAIGISAEHQNTMYKLQDLDGGGRVFKSPEDLNKLIASIPMKYVIFFQEVTIKIAWTRGEKSKALATARAAAEAASDSEVSEDEAAPAKTQTHLADPDALDGIEVVFPFRDLSAVTAHLAADTSLAEETDWTSRCITNRYGHRVYEEF